MSIFSNSQSAGQPDGYMPEFDDDTKIMPPEKSLVLQNRYLIIKSLGQGGMGAVFLAQDKHLSNRLCVVKKLRIDGFNNDEKEKAKAFFEREAMILSTLKHPNVVSIQDYFEEHENYFLVMEYVKGDNLHRLLKKRGEPFAEKQVVEWAVNILNVLEYLHSHKPPVIYRDIKPSNIMLGVLDGIKLVDFGIARPYAGQGENTHVVSGGYSPPEQYWGAADLRSDIYALGTTIYFLLTGREPVALQTCTVKRANLTISDSLDKVIQKATAQDIWLRYQSASEMRQALIEIPKQVNDILPAYIFVTGLLAMISAVCIAFVFFAFINKDGHFHDKAETFFSSNNSVDKAQILWQIPFEIATLASNEESITDTDDITPINQTVKRNYLNKKR